MIRMFLSLRLVLLPLIVGIIVYWLFRGIAIAHLSPVVSYSHNHHWFIDFMLFSLPDGLWLYALLEGLRAIWKTAIFNHALGWVWIVSIGSLGSEVAQYVHLIPGTFDLNDITAYCIAILIFIARYRNPFIQQPNPITI